MICYPAGLTEIEILVINDYWLLSDESFSGFLYTLKQIDNYYKTEKVKPVSSLAKKTSFYSPHSAFFCQDCDSKHPAINRQDYIARTKVEEAMVCSECAQLRRQRRINSAHEVLRNYKFERFPSAPYLNSLTIEESLALLSISSEQAEKNGFLGESLSDVPITGVKSIDYKILQSLIDKKALVCITEVPPNVQNANAALRAGFNRITYDNRYQKSVRYRHPDGFYPGIYLNPPDIEGCLEASDISSIINQKLQALPLSIDDAAKIHQIIKEIQLGKLYKLVVEISNEYRIPVDNSNVLRALLNHLAESYPPQNVFFTFKVKAKDSIIRMHKEAAPGYIAKHYFAKSVGNYIQYIESNGLGLSRAWGLPSSIQTSPFEALFSLLYLRGHFDWNRLSAKEVVALWLENVPLDEGVQELLTEEE
ncbi:MAG: hypothetical protein ACPGF7_03855 [Pontibacterium sp.]